MDSNFQKCTFLAFLSIELCACSLILVAVLGVELSPIIVERGMRPVVCLTRENLLSLRYCRTTLRDDTLRRLLTAVFVWALHYHSCIYRALFGPIYFKVVFPLSAASGRSCSFNKFFQ